MRHDLEVLEAQIGHCFRDRELLRRALTHRSRAFESRQQGDAAAQDNEQLEFLGDAILGFLVSEALVRLHPSFPEGRLSKLKAHLVSMDRLHQVAQALELGGFLILGKGEEMSGGRLKRALLANAVEALIAALYLDAGLKSTREFVLQQVVLGAEPHLPETAHPPTDFKGALQEFAQARKLPQPRYSTVSENGPDHSKSFTVEVRMGPELSSVGQGASKKVASQRAAEVLMLRLLAGQAD